MNSEHKKKFRVLDFNECKQNRDDALDPFLRHEARRKANIQRMRVERRLVVEHMVRGDRRVKSFGSNKKRCVLTDKTNTVQLRTDTCDLNDNKHGSIKLGDLKKVISNQMIEIQDHNKCRIPPSKEKTNSELVQLKENEHSSGRGKLTLSNLPQLVKSTKFKCHEDNSRSDLEASDLNFDYYSFLYLNIKSLFALQNADALKKFMNFLKIKKKSIFQTSKGADRLSLINSKAISNPRKDHCARKEDRLSLSKRQCFAVDDGCTYLVKEVKQVGIHLIAVKLIDPETNSRQTALFYRNKVSSVTPGAYINLHEQNKIPSHIYGERSVIYYK